MSDFYHDFGSFLDLWAMDSTRPVKKVDGVYTAEISAPGVGKENIKITVERNTIYVKGGETVNREISLNEDVNKDSIKATYIDGIIRVSFSLLEKAKPREITIE